MLYVGVVCGDDIHSSFSTAGHPQIRITVTHRITHETFKAIIELSLSFGKKKGKKGGKKVSFEDFVVVW